MVGRIIKHISMVGRRASGYLGTQEHNFVYDTEEEAKSFEADKEIFLSRSGFAEILSYGVSDLADAETEVGNFRIDYVLMGQGVGAKVVNYTKVVQIAAPRNQWFQEQFTAVLRPILGEDLHHAWVIMVTPAN